MTFRRITPWQQPFEATLDEITPYHTPSFTIQLDSTIPIAAGMGSGAAVTVAIIRALSAFLGKPLPNERISEMAYEIEKSTTAPLQGLTTPW